MKKILAYLIIFSVFSIFPVSLQADDPAPIITSVTPSSAKNGDTVFINGSNFLVPNVDVTSLKVYLFMSGGGFYTLASVTPRVNNTEWYSNQVQFKITDNITRSGRISVMVNNKFSSWSTFYMNSTNPTSAPSSPAPTMPPATSAPGVTSSPGTYDSKPPSIDSATPKVTPRGTYSPKPKATSTSLPRVPGSTPIPYDKYSPMPFPDPGNRPIWVNISGTVRNFFRGVVDSLTGIFR